MFLFSKITCIGPIPVEKCTIFDGESSVITFVMIGTKKNKSQKKIKVGIFFFIPIVTNIITIDSPSKIVYFSTGIT